MAKIFGVKALSYLAVRNRAAPVVLFILKSGAASSRLVPPGAIDEHKANRGYKLESDPVNVCRHSPFKKSENLTM
uniref:Uncharacterized protein n=1 Tax=Romanomermis culicivorax TaxID=13658 RepID=A0A915I3N9_ROMCU